MVVWGGLQPITIRVFIDLITLGGLSYSIFSKLSLVNSIVLLSSVFLIVATSGLTNRWPISFPMIPILILQGLRRLPGTPGWLKIIYTILCALFLVKAAALSVLFPPVNIAETDGPFNVGIIDFHVKMGDKDGPEDDVAVRLLYPTKESPESIPYLSPETAKEYCKSSMKFGAPPPLQSLDWMLHTWRLTRISAKRNAKPIDGKLSTIIYSHGLGGSSEIYTYQTMNLASHGHFVASITHMDGSAAIAKKSDGTVLKYDFSVGKLSDEGKEVQYVKRRRELCEQRASEVIRVAEVVKALNKDAIEGVKVSFVDTLDIESMFFMGHSFGGASGIRAADRRPDLSQSVIAHEPALDWLPDDSRYRLFHPDRVEGLDWNVEYNMGGTGGFDPNVVRKSQASHSVHDFDLLFLSSNEWYDLGWMYSPVLEEMHANGRLGSKEKVCHFEVIDKSHHNEFSDTCMLTPLWLARAVGLTGQRNPHDTAKEISEKTRSFINAVIENKKKDKVVTQ